MVCAHTVGTGQPLEIRSGRSMTGREVCASPAARKCCLVVTAWGEHRCSRPQGLLSGRLTCSQGDKGKDDFLAGSLTSVEPLSTCCQLQPGRETTGVAEVRSQSPRCLSNDGPLLACPPTRAPQVERAAVRGGGAPAICLQTSAACSPAPLVSPSCRSLPRPGPPMHCRQCLQPCGAVLHS